MISNELCKIRGEAEGEFEMRLDNIDMPEETWQCEIFSVNSSLL